VLIAFALIAAAGALAVVAVPVWALHVLKRLSDLESGLRRLDDRLNALSAADPAGAITPPPASPAPAPAPAGPASPERAAAPAPAARAPGALDLEARLGTNWLNKLGAFLLVIGLASFLTFQFQTLGALGRDLLGVAAGAALLAGGILTERRYRMFSRGLIASGWGLLFFTAYAVHHVPAARLVASNALGLLLMLGVASGMVAHALRYRSEAVTILAFACAYGALAISDRTAFTLPAAAILAVAAATVAFRLRWTGLETAAIVGAYLNHAIWLAHTTAGGPSAARDALPVSLVLLALYWLTFRVLLVMRQALRRGQERRSAINAVVNSAALMLVATRHPSGDAAVFWLLTGLGAVDLVLAARLRARRVVFETLVTTGVALIAGALPIRLDARTVTIAWLFAAEALLLAGLWSRERMLARLGVAGTAIAAVHAVVYHVLPLAVARTGGPWHASLTVGLTLALLAAALHANAWIERRTPGAFAGRVERWLVVHLSHVGTFAAAGAAWALVPELWLATAWAGLAFALALAARTTRQVRLLGHAAVGAALAGLRAMAVNMGAANDLGLWDGDLVGVTATSGLLLAAVPVARPLRAGTAVAGLRGLAGLADRVFVLVPVVLLMSLASSRLHGGLITMAWGVEAAMVFLLALWLRERSIRFAALGLLLASLLRVIAIDVWRLDQQGRYLAFIALGAVLLLVSFLYSKYRARLREQSAGAGVQR
jgi:hypothetical protein